MSVFALAGTDEQQNLVRNAISRCDFDFQRIVPSLSRIGRDRVPVDWADLSRYAASDGKGHDHVHEGDTIAHPIERVIDGRRRVLGLFYLPPYTRIVLDVTLTSRPELAQEVFLAEAAHLVDYHFMTAEMRRRFTNAVHTQSLPPDASVTDGAAFNLDGHTCSWFDVGPYSMWVGEAFMEGFIEATSDVKVTINLGHPVGPEDRDVIRASLGLGAPEVPPTSEEDAELATALRRFLETRSGQRSPLYLRTAAEAWLAKQ